MSEKGLFDDFHVQIFKKKNEDEIKHRQQLREYEKENTIIFFNGEIIFNNTNHKIKNEIISEKIHKIFNEDLNHNYYFEFNKDEKPINLIISADTDTALWCNFNVLEQGNINLNEKLISFEKSKIFYTSRIKIEKKSSVNHNFFNLYGEAEYGHIIQIANIYEQANYQLKYIGLNSANYVLESHTKLLGELANANIKNLFYENKNQKIEASIIIEHLEKETTGNIENVALLNDNSELNIKGNNLIVQGFSKSKTFQKNKIINLSEFSKVTTSPMLFVEESDVEAEHSAAVGKLDEEQIYYLQSRGLNRTQAIEMIAISYADEIIRDFDVNLKKNLVELIKSKING